VDTRKCRASLDGPFGCAQGRQPRVAVPTGVFLQKKDRAAFSSTVRELWFGDRCVQSEGTQLALT
jgi:hypothetical protein